MLEPLVVHCEPTNGEPFWRNAPSRLMLPVTERLPATVEVPVPCTMRLPVVVAPPLTVRPVAWAPAPMVVEPVEPMEKKFWYARLPVGLLLIEKVSVCPPSLRFHAEYEVLTSAPLLSLEAKFKSPVVEGMYMLYGMAALPLAPLVLASVRKRASPLLIEPSTSSFALRAVVLAMPMPREPLVLKKMLLLPQLLELRAVLRLMGTVWVEPAVEVTYRETTSPTLRVLPETALVVSVKVRSPALMFWAKMSVKRFSLVPRVKRVSPAGVMLPESVPPKSSEPLALELATAVSADASWELVT